MVIYVASGFLVISPSLLLYIFSVLRCFVEMMSLMASAVTELYLRWLFIHFITHLFHRLFFRFQCGSAHFTPSRDGPSLVANRDYFVSRTFRFGISRFVSATLNNH